jgi:hypothetical protein
VSVKSEKNSIMNKYGTVSQKSTQAHVPQNKDRVDGKHEPGGGEFVHKFNNECYD